MLCAFTEEGFSWLRTIPQYVDGLSSRKKTKEFFNLFYLELHKNWTDNVWGLELQQIVENNIKYRIKKNVQ